MDEAPIGIHPFFYAVYNRFIFLEIAFFTLYVMDFINMMNSKNWQI